MIPKDLIQRIISVQKENHQRRKFIDRKVWKKEGTEGICLMTGLKGSGKSTLLQNEFIKDRKALYLNFEDPRLYGFSHTDFSTLEEIVSEESKEILVLDEVQNTEGWASFVRSAEGKGRQVFIAASDADLVGREAEERLKGKYEHIKLMPFSYGEFCEYHKKEKNVKSFRNYFESGGLPEYSREKEKDYLHHLLKNIILGEIAVKKGIRFEKDLMRLAVYLMSHIDEEFSFNNTAKLLDIKTTKTVKEYCELFRDHYLFDYVPFYSKSERQQSVNPRKVYCIDPVLARANSTSPGNLDDAMFKNYVYLELKRKSPDVQYFREGDNECDFVTVERRKAQQLVQACLEINPDNIEREIAGVKAAMKSTRTKEAIFVTWEQKDELNGIKLVPACEWFE